MAKVHKSPARLSSEEATRLLDIVSSKFKDTIETKSNDAVSIRKKNVAWRKIYMHFNNSGDVINKRSMKTLQTEYNNIKRNLIHNAVQYYHNQTIQGGPGCSTVSEKMLNIMTSKKTGRKVANSNNIIKKEITEDSIDSRVGLTEEPAATNSSSGNASIKISDQVDKDAQKIILKNKKRNSVAEKIIKNNKDTGNKDVNNSEEALDIDDQNDSVTEKLVIKSEAVDFDSENENNTEVLIVKNEVVDLGTENGDDEENIGIKKEGMDIDHENYMDNSSFVDSEAIDSDYDETLNEMYQPLEQTRLNKNKSNSTLQDVSCSDTRCKSNFKLLNENIASLKKQLEQVQEENKRLLEYKRNKREISAQRIENTTRLLDAYKNVHHNNQANKVMLVFLVSQLVYDITSDEDDDESNDNDDISDDSMQDDALEDC